MKKILLILAILSAACDKAAAQGSPVESPSAQTRPSAAALLQEACKRAETKTVFVMFHASWCTWCHKMDASMQDPKCKNFFQKNLEVVHIVVAESPDKKNLETPGGEAMLKQYHGEGQGIPYWLLFSSAGTLLADSRMQAAAGEDPVNIGCPASAAEVDHFIAALKKGVSMNAAEEAAIRERFRKNEVK